MKILLTSLNSRYIHSNLAIRYLKACYRDRDIDIAEYTINENPLKIAMNIIEKRPRIVGFSCYIWNIENTLKACSTVKEMDKGIVIVLGGPEVSFDSMEILRDNPYIDYIIKGEGEVVLGQLLDYLENQEEQIEKIPGVVYRIEEKVVDNGHCRIISDMNSIPFPYGYEIPDKIIYYESSRGCPHNCSYCLSSTIKGVRYLNLDRVKREIKFLIENNVKLVKFVDRTFNAYKKHAMEIWNFIMEQNLGTVFHFEISADMLDDEQIDLLSRAPQGMFQFEIGVQTTNLKILNNINRKMNFEKVKRNVMKVMENGNIHCHLDLIVGLPGEGIDSFRKSFDDCMDIKPHMLQIGFLKVLKGSSVYMERDKFGIHNIKYPPYQVLYTNEISKDEMQLLMGFEEVFDVYYNSSNFRITMSYILSNTKSEFDFFMGFSMFLQEQDFFKKSFDLKDKFKLLYDYTVNSMNENTLKDIMLHDFLINTKKSWIPDFLKRQYSNNIKETIKKINGQIPSFLGSKDPGKILYVPVNTKVYDEGRGYRIEESEGILSINLQNSKYLYI